LVKNPYIDANRRRAKNLDMTIVEITGGILRAARSLTGLSQQQTANLAHISRAAVDVRRIWRRQAMTTREPGNCSAAQRRHCQRDGGTGLAAAD
jgi:hypothetical protein